MNESIVVLGGGSWGATLADHLAKKGAEVVLWEFDARLATLLESGRTLSTLPDLTLHPSVRVTADLAKALVGRTVIVNAVPSTHVRNTFRAVGKCGGLSPQSWVVSATKGIENNTLKRMSEVIGEEIPSLHGRVGVLSGPSHAEEVARSLPTAIVAAGPEGIPEKIVGLFNTECLRVYTNADFVGVELCGALKNIYAVACGVSDGLGFGDNTKAALMTRGLNEMVRLGVSAGAQVITFLGLAGLGDLIVTCTSPHSRNRALGEKIGRGLSASEALAEMTMVAEGYPTTRGAKQLADRQGLSLPIVSALHDVLYDGKSGREALKELLSRPPIPEMLHVGDFVNQKK